jgi:hypothetical protein
MPAPHRASGSDISSPRQPQRLGKNVRGYVGQGIDISAVLADCVAAAQAHGWRVEEIHPAPSRIFAFTRIAPRKTQPAPAVYISTGIHGDEPAGPLAVRQLLQENRWPAALDLWICPCLNPTGFLLNRRENAEGLDLNREYLQPQAAETLAHIAWLRRQPQFALSLCLHEDWESHGFYVYELNPDNQPSPADALIGRVAMVCPIDRSETIEGRAAVDGVIRPSLDPRSRPQWPEAFFLLTHKTRLSCTFEAPSDFPLPIRVAALVTGVNAALETVSPPVQHAPPP